MLTRRRGVCLCHYDTYQSRGEEPGMGLGEDRHSQRQERQSEDLGKRFVPHQMSDRAHVDLRPSDCHAVQRHAQQRQDARIALRLCEVYPEPDRLAERMAPHPLHNLVIRKPSPCPLDRVRSKLHSKSNGRRDEQPAQRASPPDQCFHSVLHWKTFFSPRCRMYETKTSAISDTSRSATRSSL